MQFLYLYVVYSDDFSLSSSDYHAVFCISKDILRDFPIYMFR